MQIAKNRNEPPMLVFLLVDGEPEPVTDYLAYFQQTLGNKIKKLEELNVELFVVALNDASRSREQWVNLIGSDYYFPINESTDLAGVYNFQGYPNLIIQSQSAFNN